MFTVKKIEIVPAKTNAKQFDLLITHGDGSQGFFSRSFTTKKEAEEVKAKILPQKPKCGACGSGQVYYRQSTKEYVCRMCPAVTKMKILSIKEEKSNV